MKTKGWFDVTGEELRILFERRPDPEGSTRVILWLTTIFLTPVTLTGALLGYVRGYNRFMSPLDRYPVFYPMQPIVRIAMIAGAAMIWLVIAVTLWMIGHLLPREWLQGGAFLYYIGINFAIGVVVFLLFRVWRNRITSAMLEGEKFGTARFARPDELADYRAASGLYIGGGHTFDDKGHILTVAGTRGGKGTSLIIPNLLGVGNFQGFLGGDRPERGERRHYGALPAGARAGRHGAQSVGDAYRAARSGAELQPARHPQ